MALNPNVQGDWAQIYNESSYSEETLCAHTGIKPAQFHKYVSATRTPRKKNHAKMVEAMTMANSAKGRIMWHPSYGFATPEQIERLREIGLCPERDQILKDIELQTKARGRSK